ncbi:Uncharacterized protein YPO0396 [Amycolatopsis marina]|uniref:Uncharacterized protein YPO0396 n=1 Tax=Amycolatopsis marina TaxID=490629 RepID=A0A1I1BU40_9PSEU|nr:MULTISPECIES: SbcC/MukB-like Walker B domain-containing protein [Amycolatopsis]SFB53667.1 Uncharacterized protein YPO0396 [Amycolatopsis marina]
MPETVNGSRTIHLGQFRITRLQVINWGTFCGYKDFPIDERGMLLTGPSGSGKSSLMDAHSIALLPTNDHRFNASADLTARGAKQGTRSVTDYVRGAWSENDDEHEQSHVQYLRGGKTTWSAVGATYEDGLGAVTTAVVVKWFTGAETDGASIKTMHQLHDGHFDLRVLETWAAQEYNTRWLKATYPADYPDNQANYMRALAKRVGLGTSKTALSLLGKAKSMKNVGDLNQFIRSNMLDTPVTFGAAQKMLDSFTPLNAAYETARRAHTQEHVLRDVPEYWTKYQKSRETGNRAAALLGAPMDHYLREVHLRVLQEDMDRLDLNIDALDRRLTGQEQAKNDAYQSFISLDQQLRREGQAMQELKVRLQAAKDEATARESAYGFYASHVTRLERRCPEDEPAFTALREEVPEILHQAQADKKKIEPDRHTTFAALADTRRLHDSKAAELLALQTAGSLIPQRESKRREYIAQATNVPVSDLPYAAELIDIVDGEERWRPAAEKVLRNYAMRMLVPDVHKDVVREFIDNNNMGGIVEYSVVTATSAHRHQPPVDVLAGKLTVDTNHPSGPWLAGQLARQFEHKCVETARDLEQHRIAVTVRGTVKLPGNHYRKDDRPELTNPSSYVLGANTAAKRAALEIEVTELAVAKEQALEAADELDVNYRNLESRITAATQIADYDTWAQLDHWTSKRNAGDFEQRIDEIKASNVDLQRLERDRDDAETTWTTASELCSTTKSKITEYGQQHTQLLSTYEHELPKPHTIADDEDRTYLDRIFADIEIPVNPAAMRQVRSAFGKALERHRDLAEADGKYSFTKVKTAVDRFLESWRDFAPDASGDIERSGGDFAALHEEIVQRRLPEAMSQFQQIITEDMVPSIGMLQREIENAATDIKRRVYMVNDGLRRVKFNPDTHLQIAFKANPSNDVKEFQRKVDALLSNAPAAQRDAHKALAQFKRVRELMTRFTADDAASRQWRSNVLDVRTSYAFYGREENSHGITVYTYRNTASNSGGEQEKLVAFCLAAALSYNLADDDSDGRPRFAPLMLDEAFSKSDETFSGQALSAFDEFGFQLLIAAPIRMSGIVEPFIGQAILVEKRMTTEGSHSNAAMATFGDLAVRRTDESDGGTGAAA